MIRSILTLGLAVALPSHVLAEVPRASMAGYTLGMTIEEAKAVPVIVTNSMTTGFGAKSPSKGMFRCQGEPKASAFLPRDKFDAALGVDVCAPHNRENYSDYFQIGTDLTGQGYFRFLKGALYRIDITFNERQLSTVIAALEGRYGDPAKEHRGEIKNRLGASFPQTTAVWKVGEDEITLVSPSGKIDRFSVTYREPKADDNLTSESNKARGAASGL